MRLTDDLRLQFDFGQGSAAGEGEEAPDLAPSNR